MSLTHTLQQELNWLEKIIKLRIEFPEADLTNFDLENFLSAFPNRRKNITHSANYDYTTIPPSTVAEDDSVYSGIIRKCNYEERLLLILALSVHIEPGLINKIVEEHHYSEVIKKSSTFWYQSGITPNYKQGIIPTGRFWIYLLSGTDLPKRMKIMSQISNAEFQLIASGMVDINADDNEILYGGTIKIEPTVLINLFRD